MLSKFRLAFKKSPTLRYGVPMMLLIVGGSFGLREFSQIRYDSQKYKKRMMLGNRYDFIGTSCNKRLLCEAIVKTCTRKHGKVFSVDQIRHLWCDAKRRNVEDIHHIYEADRKLQARGTFNFFMRKIKSRPRLRHFKRLTAASMLKKRRRSKHPKVCAGTHAADAWQPAQEAEEENQMQAPATSTNASTAIHISCPSPKNEQQGNHDVNKLMITERLVHQPSAQVHTVTSTKQSNEVPERCVSSPTNTEVNRQQQALMENILETLQGMSNMLSANTSALQDIKKILQQRV